MRIYAVYLHTCHEKEQKFYKCQVHLAEAGVFVTGGARGRGGAGARGGGYRLDTAEYISDVHMVFILY